MREFKLTELVDLEQTRRLMELLHRATRLQASIVSTDGDVLGGGSPQSICRRFHDKNAMALERCQAGIMAVLSAADADDWVERKCGNGLWEAGLALKVEGRLLGTLLVGQFLYDDEPVDPERFRRQAVEYDLDPEEYIAAFERVPVFSRDAMRGVLETCAGFVGLLSNLCRKNILLENDFEAARQAQTDLRDGEERYRRLYNNPLVGLFRTEVDSGRLLECNERFAQIFGYSGIPECLGSFVAPEHYVDPAQRGGYLERIKSPEGTINDFDVQMTRRDGTVMWMRISARLFREDNHVDGVMIDVTAQKEAEEALRESRETAQMIGAAAQDAIIMMDGDGGISYWNPAAERVFGYNAEEVLGRNLHETLAPARYLTGYNRAFDRFRQTGDGLAVGRTLELTAIHRDRHEFPIELSISSVKLKGRWCAIGILRDITERKQYEEQLARQAEELQGANRRLAEAMKHAEEMAVKAEVANAAKSQFLANMSHEIRTPLNGIIGMAQLLHGTPLTAEQREYLDTAQSSGEALLDIVNDILDFSKIEAGRLELESVDFDLRAMIEDVGDMLAPRAHEKDLEFGVLVRHDVPGRIKGDPGRLRQVVVNLASNAIKFTETGEVVVSMALDAGTPTETNGRERARIRFEVTDTGIGVAPERQAHLFEPFTQADTSTTRQYGGTGLGLAISRQLVESMGGQLHLNSELGKGSCFSFTIAFETAEPMLGAAVPVILDGIRVLVVDRSPTGRATLRELLAHRVCDVTDVADAKSAIDAIAGARPDRRIDVVLVDFLLSGMSAAEFARSIKESPGGRDARLLLLTSTPQRGDAAEMIHAGYEGYLTKPIKQSQLLDAIGRLFSEVQGEAVTGESRLVTKHTLREGTHVKLLLVEDNPVNQKVAARMLQRLGYQCDLASNGQEAVEALHRTPYDLVFMDCQMPVMDGFAAAEQIRENEGESRHTPIIALTAMAMKGDAEACLDAGMDGYLAKPIGLAELQSVLERFFPEAAAARSTPETQQTEPVDQGATEPTTPRPQEQEPEPPINMPYLDDVTCNDKALQRDLMATFLQDTKERLAALADAADGGEIDSALRVAHTLKGASATVGAVGLQTLAANLEQCFRSNNVEEAREVMRKCERELRRAAEFVKNGFA